MKENWNCPNCDFVNDFTAECCWHCGEEIEVAPDGCEQGDVALDRLVSSLRSQVEGARRILDCYSSPFPDAIERRKRQEQLAYVEKLERELREAESKQAANDQDHLPRA